MARRIYNWYKFLYPVDKWYLLAIHLHELMVRPHPVCPKCGGTRILNITSSYRAGAVKESDDDRCRNCGTIMRQQKRKRLPAPWNS